jgi:phosphoglycolate phosphatase-like HAD superfamily hydrolase
MKRHYYIGDNLEDLASAERGLEAAGISCLWMYSHKKSKPCSG